MMFNWLKNKLQNRSVSLNSDDFFELVSGIKSSTGLSINPKTILGNSAVKRAVELISSAAQIPLITYKRLPDGGKERATQLPIYQLLKTSPAPFITSYNFFETMISQKLLHGNSFAFIKRDTFGTPIELQILDPQNTSAFKENGQLGYITRINNQDRKITPDNIIHFRGMGGDEISGYSLCSILRESLSTGLALQKYGNIFFKQGGSVGVVIEMPRHLTDEAIERFKKSWGNIHNGLDAAHKPSILEDGMKLSQNQVNNDNAQWLQSKTFDLINISNIFGLPSSKLGSSQNTSYGSLESDERSFLQDLQIHLVAIEQELSIKLLTKSQREIYHVEFLREQFLQMSSEVSNSILTSQLNNGLLSWEECRRILNKPINTEETFRRPANIIDVGEETEKEIVEPVEKVEEEIEEEKEDDTSTSNSTSVKLVDVTRATLTRLVKRMSASSAPLTTHLNIISESLPFWESRDISEWLEGVEEELESSLPEQRAKVFSRIDIEKIIEEIL